MVVTATRGEHGTDDPLHRPPGRLAPLRVRDPAASLAVLAGGTGRIEHRFLGDATGSWHLDGTLAHGHAERTVAKLSAIVDEIAPDTILTFGPDGVTGYPTIARSPPGPPRAGQVSWTGARLLHADLTAGFYRRFGDLLGPMDGDADMFPVIPRRQLAVELTLRPAELDRKVAALAAAHQPDQSLARAVGAALPGLRRDSGVPPGVIRPRTALVVAPTAAAG